ncbi:MAG: hypothetical protein ACAI18_03845 [Gemmatimonadales bacterium]
MTDTSDLTCPVCGRRLPIQWKISALALRKIGLALLIPLLIWLAMSALFR